MLAKFIPDEKIRSVVEWVVAILLALAVYFFLTNFVYSTAEISGPSMNPTLTHGEKVIVNRMAYWFSSPKHGDIIAFPYPAYPEENYIKRVVGIPGDEVDIREGRVYLNGELVEFDFTLEEMMPAGDVSFPLTVSEGEYFVLGDNRDNSRDSRYSSVGCIKESNIIGKVSFRFWPLSEIGFIN